jgi:hypothetical protein
MLTVLISCGLLIDFPEDPQIGYWPETANQILQEGELPHICFDFPVDKYSVESLMCIREASGAVSGFHYWEDTTVFFQPQPELIPGRRYVLSFDGIYYDLEGGEHQGYRVVPFYYVQLGGSAPYVVSVDPAPGEFIDGNATIRIAFSEPIDPSSLERGIVIQPDTPVRKELESGGAELLLTAREGWEECRCCRICLTDGLTDEAGFPLVDSLELVYWIQEDIVSPRVVLVEPGLNNPSQLYPATGYGLKEAVGLNEVLRIRFSEEMDTAVTADALSLQPTIPTERYWIDGSCLVVVPADTFEADTEYLLDFSDSASDRAGNAISLPEPIRFVTIAGEIEVSTEFIQDAVKLGPGEYSTASALEIRPYPVSSSADYELLIHFTGTRFDSNAEKYAAQEAISLVCIFPDIGVANPVATGYSWMAEQVLGVTYSELEPSSADQRVYYLLRIRGGPGGLSTDDGHRLAQDLEQLLVTAVE